ncbi:MAG TPA: alpha-amylase family glycosyl hydrolase [Candidatus Binatia bacterium]|nr:alpha-amylase family glycosyl hydrolase [Candidatus Binatia bacterium]
MKKVHFFLLLVMGVSIFGLNAGPVCSEIVLGETADSPETRYGAHLDPDGWVHFVVHAPEATAVNLLLFEKADARTPTATIPLHHDGPDWKIKIKGEGIGAGLLYLYQAQGPREVFFHTEADQDQYGPMFNENFYLTDPYAYATQDVTYSAVFSAVPYVDSTAPIYNGGAKSIVYDHAKDPDPGHVEVKREDLIIYELHVQDYTARIPGLDPAKRGTYVGLAQDGLRTPGGLAAGIDHLVELGVTAVELMPVMEYDEETGNAPGRYNHWGYMTSNFFAPEARYASQAGKQVEELKALIKALHDRGITVFLDVVYNHTAEAGPWLDHEKLAAKYYNLRGLDNTEVYRATADGRFYFNNTGTGNDLAYAGGDGTFPKQLVEDSLALWYGVYGVDGFRFDLARILADGSGNAADWVDNDKQFAAAHLHAEPWDMGGQWYDFMDNWGWSAANNRWAKWLGKYRDKMRKFSASSLQNRTAFKQLIEGYGSVSDTAGAAASTKPWRSVNVVAVHDGYTLRDCTYFNDSDGSQNCWDSGGDENLRREREKLLLGVLFTSQGVPLLLQGDEFGSTKASARSQEDARNTYNYESSTGDQQINNVSWLDWRLKDGDKSESPTGPTYGPELFHWTRDLIQLRKKWTHFRRAEFAEYVDQAWDGGAHAGSGNDGKFSYAWEGPGDGQPTQVAVVWWGKAGEPDLMVLYNEDWNELAVTNLATWSRGDWKVLAKSWADDAGDFCDLNTWETACAAVGGSLTLPGRSMAILISSND